MQVVCYYEERKEKKKPPTKLLNKCPNRTWHIFQTSKSAGVGVASVSVPSCLKSDTGPTVS